MDLAEDAEGEGGQADDDASVGLGLLGIEDEPDRDGAEEQGYDDVEAAEGAGDQHLYEVADGAAEVGPGACGDDQCEAEEQQGDAVLAVGRVESFGSASYAAEHGSHGVGGAEPDGAGEAVDAAGRGGCGFGCGPGGAAAFFAGALLGAVFLTGALGGGGFLRGRSLLRRGTAGALRGARRALGTLAGRT
ncbi:hypothetical protein V3O60_09770 [Streptomyces xanthochromogenes]